MIIRIIKILILLTLTINVQGQNEGNTAAKLYFSLHRISVGTGDHSGWKIGIGGKHPISNRLNIGIEAGIWISIDYGDEPLFKTIEGYPTIDKYPDNYPFPDIIFNQNELTDYGVKGYTPQDNFWQSISADLFITYDIVENRLWNFNMGLGLSIIKTDYTYINEEWSAEVKPPRSDVEQNFIMIIPLYVRYLDLGSKVNLRLTRNFGRLTVGTDLVWYEYTSSRNLTYGLNLGVKI